jgi:hypothetical protein
MDDVTIVPQEDGRRSDVMVQYPGIEVEVGDGGPKKKKEVR